MSESLGDGGGKSPCFEVDLYERTSSPLTPFVLITAKCRRPRFMYVIDGWLAGRDGPGGPGRAEPGRIGIWREMSGYSTRRPRRYWLPTQLSRSLPSPRRRAASVGIFALEN